MLSRTADNLYWLSRYIERAEYLARTLDATQRLSALPLAYVGTSNEWESAVATAGCAAAFFKLYDEANEANVTDFLEQSCGIPLTNVLAPGAMGTSRQVAPDTTAEGQAENRRVVVRVLQNKGIAGT